MTAQRWGEQWQQEMYAAARAALPAPVWRYFEQGAHAGVSAAEALESWSSLRLAPHALRDVSAIDLGTVMLGERFSTPLGIAPTSMQHQCHPEGEVAMARAAAATDTLLVVPTNSGSRWEDIAATGARWWLQTYLTRDRSIVATVIRRAVEAGANAIVLTADTPQVSTRFGAYDEGWARVVHAPSRVNFDPAGANPGLPGAAHADDLTESDIEWLCDLSGLPVVIKGILRPDDARRAVQYGASAVWVSNHGGRQLDRAISTRAALGPIVSSLGRGTPVYVDGGLRCGLDVLAALACGAAGVFLGRVPVMALAADGENGVTWALGQLRRELWEAFQLAGCRSPTDAAGLLAGPS